MRNKTNNTIAGLDMPTLPMLEAGSIKLCFTPVPVYHDASTAPEVAKLAEILLNHHDYAVHNLYAYYTNSAGGLVAIKHLAMGSSSGVLADVRTIVAIGAQLNACGVSLVHSMPYTEWPAINEAGQRSLAHLQEALHICQFRLHCYLTVSRCMLNQFYYNNELTTESRLQYEELFFTRHNPHRMAGYIIG